MRRVLLAIFATATLGACGAVDDIIEDCFCGPRIGQPKIDALFTAVDEAAAAAARVDAKLNTAVMDLAVSLELPPTASDIDVRDALCAAFADAGSSFEISYEPPVCEAEVSVAARAAAECEATYDPGAVVVECQGSCDGTCRASCTGECRVPTVSATCQGTCHGRCAVDIDGACYGTCHGQCTGTCSSPRAGGGCEGSCDGTCTGTCELTVSASCTGECTGECEIDVEGGDCNARCEGTCEGSCQGYCDGDVRAPSVDADCQAQVEVRAQSQVTCEPPAITYGQSAVAVAHITPITHAVARMVAANAEVGEVLGAVIDFAGPLGTVGEAVIDGDVSASQAACATTRLDDASEALENTRTVLEGVVVREDLILTCL